MRRILGIDPGSRITGYGIIEHNEKGKPICLGEGTLQLTAKEIPERLGKLFIEIQNIVNAFKPTELAIEKVFVHKNALSALKLGQARGVAIAAAVSADLVVYEYAPLQIKQAIVGKGRAEKSQIQHMVQVLLSLAQKPATDAADALAAALCHFHTLHAVQWLSHRPARRRYKRNKEWASYDRTTSR